MVCILCGGQGHFNAFGACGEGEKLGDCTLCHGTKVSAANLTVKCTPCDGKSGTGAFGPALPFDTHYRIPCLACEGKGYHPTGTILTPCGSCGGQGAEGAFGHCTPGDTNVKSLCGACHGKGCTITHAAEHKAPAPAPTPVPAPAPGVDQSKEESPISAIKIAAKVDFHNEPIRIFAGRTLLQPVYAGHEIMRVILAAEDFDAKELGFEYRTAVYGLTTTNSTDIRDGDVHQYPQWAGLSNYGVNGISVRLVGARAGEYTVKYQLSTNNAVGNWTAVTHDGEWNRLTKYGASRIKIWVEKK